MCKLSFKIRSTAPIFDLYVVQHTNVFDTFDIDGVVIVIA